MLANYVEAFRENFLGHAPDWYKWLVLVCFVINPVLLAIAGPLVASWAILLEFIGTLTMALRCYPLQPGGLIAIQAVVLGLATPAGIQQEIETGLPVILLLIFMVAAIYFLREMLVYTFTKLLVRVQSRSLLALMFVATGAVLSAFLDALTVLAVIMTVVGGFYAVYHRVASGKSYLEVLHDASADDDVREINRENLDAFRAHLRALLMHGAVGTTIGGVCTLVGEPQNLLIGKEADWNFIRFAAEMAPVTVPAVIAGLATCLMVERFAVFGYGSPVPAAVRQVLVEFEHRESTEMSSRHKYLIFVQAAIAILLVFALAFHVAEIGVVGLAIIVLATAFTGIVDEGRLGKAFEAALPFTALLVVFFAIVGMIHQQDLFGPFLDWVLQLAPDNQPIALFGASGLLSIVSDNVFVATIYITQVKEAMVTGAISPEQFDAMAVAINTGTNIPSIATPNGQAAFLFLLTSAVAPLVRLSYFRMVWMALPYFLSMTAAAALGILYIL
jgi:Na+:H+ antiporter, NhaB family